MPTAPPYVCRCGSIASGTCTVCRARPADPDRASSTDRGYNHDWKRFRDHFVRENPLCADCFAVGRYTPTKEVHHVLKLADHPELRLDWSNCLGLCRPCHSVRTAKGE